MSLRARKFIVCMTLLIYTPLYIGAAAWLASSIERPPLLLEALMYVALGVVWIFPLRPLFVWAGRGRRL